MSGEVGTETVSRCFVGGLLSETWRLVELQVDFVNTLKLLYVRLFQNNLAAIDVRLGFGEGHT